jgi:hypothetical protein
MFGFRKSKGEDATPAEIAASTLEADIALVRAWSPEERAEKEKKFLRRIDLRLLPILVRRRMLPMTRLLTGQYGEAQVTNCSYSRLLCTFSTTSTGMLCPTHECKVSRKISASWAFSITSS